MHPLAPLAGVLLLVEQLPGRLRIPIVHPIQVLENRCGGGRPKPAQYAPLVFATDSLPTSYCMQRRHTFIGTT